MYRIPAGTAATIIFTGGLLGAFVFTPIVGLVADRTNTRWGKFRPWILWTAIPFGVLSLLAFSTPDLGEHGKVVYALTTYTLLVMVYAANNLPYSALSGVITGSMAERNSLSSYRFVAVMVAQFVIQVLLLPLVLILGGGDKVQGFHNTMALFAVVGTVFFLITFFTTQGAHRAGGGAEVQRPPGPGRPHPQQAVAGDAGADHPGVHQPRPEGRHVRLLLQVLPGSRGSWRSSWKASASTASSPGSTPRSPASG